MRLPFLLPLPVLCAAIGLISQPGLANGLHAADGVRMVDLGTLGGPYAWANGINNHAQVVGHSFTSEGKDHAFLWENGRMLDLGVLGSYGALSSSTAYAINDRGQVVGQSSAADSSGHAFLWENGVMTDLAPLLGPGTSAALGINANGDIVGLFSVGLETHPFLLRNGVRTDLGSLGGGVGAAWSVNDKGQVVGTSTTATGERRSFLWENGVMTALPKQGKTDNTAFSINDRGQVAGLSGDGRGVGRALLWAGGAAFELGTLGGTFAAANAVNSQGQVVGMSTPPKLPNSHAFLWDKGTMLDLGTLGGLGSQAQAINDSGQIVGTSEDSSGTPRAFLIPVLSPVYNFVPPGPPPSGMLQSYWSNSLGNRDRNVVFDALADVTVSSIGVRIDPLPFGVAVVAVGIWEVTPGGGYLNLGTRADAPVLTATAPVTDAGPSFYDVPVQFTFRAGRRYSVGFSQAAPAGGWADSTNMEFYHFGAGQAINPPYRDCRPYSVNGVFTVLGGGYGSDFTQSVTPHIRFK